MKQSEQSGLLEISEYDKQGIVDFFDKNYYNQNHGAVARDYFAEINPLDLAKEMIKRNPFRIKP